MHALVFAIANLQIMMRVPNMCSKQGRFEMPIIQQLIRDAGGEGKALEVA